MSHYKIISLCADDFGINPQVSQGILKLVVRRRLSAVSCMTNLPDFNLYVDELRPLKDRVRIGLHFNLTEGFLLSEPNQPCFSLNELLIKSHLHWLKPTLIAQEFNTQLDHYIFKMGDFPDFIDGHQHVHQFPLIRQEILKIYKQRLQKKGISIRSTVPSINLSPYRLKAYLLAISGGKAFSSELKKWNIPHNHYFAGIYDFNPQSNYRELFKGWLHLMPSNMLVMCHPAEGENRADAISPARNREMDYFLSDDFLADCQEYHVQLDLK